MPDQRGIGVPRNRAQNRKRLVILPLEIQRLPDSELGEVIIRIRRQSELRFLKRLGKRADVTFPLALAFCSLPSRAEASVILRLAQMSHRCLAVFGVGSLLSVAIFQSLIAPSPSAVAKNLPSGLNARGG